MKRFFLIFLSCIFWCLPVSARWDVPRQGVTSVNIYVPHYKAVPRRNKIYQPNHYNCSMRRKLKYCVDNKGRALSGQIVVSDGENVAYETYLNGYQNGETSVYTLNGILIEKAMYKKGLREGEAAEYFLNGNVWLIKHYDNGYLHGRVEEFDINGALIGRMNYKKGWFKDGFCVNERSGKTMHERHTDGLFNQIMPCNNYTDDELM